MFLHGDRVDIDLDGEVDCWYSGGTPLPPCNDIDGDSVVTCDESITAAWMEGYSAYLSNVRSYTAEIREYEDSLFIITNGQPDPVNEEYVNGRYYEDTNGFGVKDDNWSDVIENAFYCDTSSTLHDTTRFVVFLERDRTFSPFGGDPKNFTNLAQMRLTMALSLMIDSGFYGTTGSHNSRTPLWDDVAIEDYYDEYAVDFNFQGFRSPDFQEVYWDTTTGSRDSLALSDSLLLEARYYLGEPLDTMMRYRENGVDLDVLYREFDHGLVIADLGIFEADTTMVRLDSLLLQDDPRDRTGECHGHLSPCQWRRICGSYIVLNYGKIYLTRYNDGRNNCEDEVDSVLVDNPADDSFYGRSGDAIILLKEGDGFEDWNENPSP
jgi:hypothetical protein